MYLSLSKKNIHILKRLRRNRKSSSIRELLKETRLSKSDLIAPFFLIEGEKQKQPLKHMPNIYRLSSDLILKEAESLHQKGIQAIALFPVVPKEKKCSGAKEAYNSKNHLLQTIRLIKKEIPSLCLISDIALDPYTSHGHDGIVGDSQKILNDATLEILGKMALVQAEAGVDIVAPSDMMDGRVAYIREKLDKNHFTDTSILSYAAKYASCFYAPFREALNSKLSFGNKKTYQIDPANQRESLLEALLDEQEGADILMVKPASMYLDIIHQLKEATKRPIAAFHVSGEYAMILAAEEKGYLNGADALYETLLSIKRAGASIIFSYAIPKILPLLS